MDTDCRPTLESVDGIDQMSWSIPRELTARSTHRKVPRAIHNKSCYDRTLNRAKTCFDFACVCHQLLGRSQKPWEY